MFDIRSAQLYSVFYYGASGSSLAANFNPCRLKKPRRPNLDRLHLIDCQSLRTMFSNRIQIGWLTVISLFMPLILCLTVIASVGIGVIAAYAAVIGILQAFGRAAQQRLAEARPRLVLVPTQNHASGD